MINNFRNFVGISVVFLRKLVAVCDKLLVGSKVGLYFNTIKYLTLKQVLYRVVYLVRSGNSGSANGARRREHSLREKQWVNSNAKIPEDYKFEFLNCSGDFRDVGWDGNQRTKLWRYHQHYFDWLISKDACNHVEVCHELIALWCRDNERGQGVGWEAYPTSLRIVNWIKWDSRYNKLSSLELQSLYLQVAHLSRNLEWHILGNHLLANAKALVFAGVFFEGSESEGWLTTGLSILQSEIEEQVLQDGAHFELSPMYHSIILLDFLELFVLLRDSKESLAQKVVVQLESLVPTMLRWLSVMTHPDGGVSFFNDSCFGASQEFSVISRYAAEVMDSALEIQGSGLNTCVELLKESGYFRVAWSNSVLIGDVGMVGPTYLPGHGHGDALSFELSVGGHRLFVNGGVSTYEVSSRRDLERSTFNHNTVEVDGESSSELWSAFRVARRSAIKFIRAEVNEDSVLVEAACRGYRKLFGNTHLRRWSFIKSRLIVSDSVQRSNYGAVARFHLHPSIELIRVGHNVYEAKLRGSNSLCVINVKQGSVQIKPWNYAERFGKTVLSCVMEVSLVGEKDLSSCVELCDL